ncbi:hypothetical protein QM816_04515 [Streptococcus oralis]|uniref:hypothetical protein n=1 Tax=Streptococcus oralis TaxID=1303 RepID=UPI0039C0C3AD
MKFTKIMSMALALVVLLLSLMVFRMFQKTQLVMFESVSFGMSPKSFEEVLGNASEVEEEEETAYRDTWRAEDPYFYKTGRLFYHYEQITLKGYTGRATFTFSKSHHLETVAAYFPVTSKAEQEALLDNLSQTIKKELEELPDYQSMTTDTLGIYDDGYRYKVKLKGKQWELWVDVYPTENKYATDTETDKYTIRVDQFLMYP